MNTLALAKKLILILIILVAVPVIALAGEVVLEWDAPTTNSDGTELNDLSGYKIYYGTTSGVYTEIEDVGNVTTYRVTDLAETTWFFAVTAYDLSLNESEYSNEVNVKLLTIPMGPVLSCNATASVCGKCVYNCDAK